MDLTAAKRKDMPDKEFALAGKRFPVNDKEHARLAKSGASRAEHVGNISKATEEKIDAKADRKLGKSSEDRMKSRYGAK